MAHEGTFVHYTGEEALAYRAFQLEQDEWWEVYLHARLCRVFPQLADIFTFLFWPEFSRRRNGWMSGGCRRRSDSPAGDAIVRTAGVRRDEVDLV